LVIRSLGVIIYLEIGIWLLGFQNYLTFPEKSAILYMYLGKARENEFQSQFPPICDWNSYFSIFFPPTRGGLKTKIKLFLKNFTKINKKIGSL